MGNIDFSPVIVPQKAKTENKEIPNDIKNMSNDRLARLCVGVLNDMTLSNNIGNSGKAVAGSAGETYSDDKIKPLVLADGPAGLRISKNYQIDENGRVKASDNSMGA